MRHQQAALHHWYRRQYHNDGYGHITIILCVHIWTTSFFLYFFGQKPSLQAAAGSVYHYLPPASVHLLGSECDRAVSQGHPRLLKAGQPSVHVIDKHPVSSPLPLNDVFDFNLDLKLHVLKYVICSAPHPNTLHGWCTDQKINLVFALLQCNKSSKYSL